MSIVIADDHERERTWLTKLLRDNMAELGPIHEATDGQQAVDLTISCNPALVILDIEMPVLSGMKAAEKILARLPQTGIIILSHHQDEIWVRQLWRMVPHDGAFGYVLKDSSDEQVIQAVQAVLTGDCWVHPRIQKILKRSESGPGSFTDNEFQVLAYIALGLTDRAIAKRLFLTEKAIQSRLKSVYQKLGMPLKGTSDDDEFNHRCRTLNIAFRRGLINKLELDEWESTFLDNTKRTLSD